MRASTTADSYGRQLTDEMFNAWFEAVLADQDRSQPAIVQLWKYAPLKQVLYLLDACMALVICCRFLPASGNVSEAN